MPRIARIIAPGHPHHVNQRGNNRSVVFFDDEDRQTYLKLLTGYARKYDLLIWAYCLMDNHVHLLVLPETEIALARGIGVTTQVYTQYLNRKLGQSGRVWQNRFFSCVVENEKYLWSAARYIERNPLKVRLVESAEVYRWSSAKAQLLGVEDPVLSSPSWLDHSDRAAYAAFIKSENEEMDNEFRKTTRTGRPFGSEEFVNLLESRLKRPLWPRKQDGQRNLGSVLNFLQWANNAFRAPQSLLQIDSLSQKESHFRLRRRVKQRPEPHSRGKRIEMARNF